MRTVVIEPSVGWRPINIKELIEFRDLLFFLVWRDIKVLYAQTILGFSWGILNPLIQIVVFSIVFGQIAKLNTDGIPYVLFSAVAIIPWTFMTDAMTSSSQSLVAGQGMLGKVYFPRLLFPLAGVLAKIGGFLVSLLLLFAVLIYYGVGFTWGMAFLPIFGALMVLVPAGVGVWLSALAIRYRDVKFALPFVIRMLMYTAPIVYSASAIPDHYRFWYSLNPIVGVVEGFRACLLGLPIEWVYVLPGAAVSVLVAATGLLYFKKMEPVFADVI